jgi:hypothetical protein
MSLLLVLALAVPAPAADKNQPQAVTEQDYNALAQSSPVIGKLKSISPTDKTFTLEIDTNLLQTKNGVRNAVHTMEQQEHILRMEQDILQTRNPVQRAQKVQRLNAELERLQVQAARGTNAGQVVTQHKDFDLESTADAKVRRQDPPVQYDDKGNVKKYSQQELKGLKGDPKLTGYAADWDGLQVGQMVKVSLSKAPDKADNKDNKDKKTDSKPQASLIVIIKDAPDADAAAGKKK